MSLTMRRRRSLVRAAFRGLAAFTLADAADAQNATPEDDLLPAGLGRKDGVLRRLVFGKAEDLKFNLYINEKAKISGPLQRAADRGEVIIIKVPME